MSNQPSNQYWLISVPTENKKEDATRKRLESKTSAFSICSLFPFPLPTLKVGTIDALMALSDELTKIDTAVEQTVKKLERTGTELVRNEAREAKERDEQEKKSDSKKSDSKKSTTGKSTNSKGNTTILDFKPEVNGLPAEQFLEKFKWDDARYNPKGRSIAQLADAVYKDAVKDDEELKTKITDFNELKTNIINIERKETGSLLVRPLGPLISKNDVVEKEFLTTLFIVIPKAKEQEFRDTYEILEDLHEIKEKEKEEERKARQKEKEAREEEKRLADEKKEAEKPKEQKAREAAEKKKREEHHNALLKEQKHEEKEGDEKKSAEEIKKREDEEKKKAEDEKKRGRREESRGSEERAKAQTNRTECCSWFC